MAKKFEMKWWMWVLIIYFGAGLAFHFTHQYTSSLQSDLLLGAIRWFQPCFLSSATGCSSGGI